MTSLDLPKSSQLLKFVNKFKFIITQGQLVQFALILTQSLVGFYEGEGCGWSFRGKMLQTGYMMTMLGLFGHFYYMSYIQPKKLAKAKQAEPEVTPEIEELAQKVLEDATAGVEAVENMEDSSESKESVNDADVDSPKGIEKGPVLESQSGLRERKPKGLFSI